MRKRSKKSSHVVLEKEEKRGLTLILLSIPFPPPPPLVLSPMSGIPNGSDQKDSFVYLRGMDTVDNDDTVSIGELPDRSISGEYGGC